MNSTIAKIVVGSLFMSQLAMAELGEKHSEKWRKEHPRQSEVNGRLQNQQNRVQQGENKGELTQQQANQVNKQDHRIYKEEQRMKERNGSNSLTAGQQAKLNRQENGVSKEIKNDEAGKAPSTTTPVAPTAPANN